MDTRSRTEKLNRSYIARFRAGEEAAFVQVGTVDRVKDREIAGFHIRIRKSGSKFVWANAKLTFTIGDVSAIEADKARSIAVGVKARVETAKGVQPWTPADIRSWIATELLGAPMEPAKPGWSVRLLREKFLAQKAQTKAAATVRNYQSDLHCPEVNAIADRQAADITSIDVAAIRDSVAKRGQIQSNRVLAAVSSMFTYARGEPDAKVAANPCTGVNRAGKEVERDRHLPWHELKRLIQALPEADMSPGVGCAMLWTLATAQRKRANREIKKEDFSDGVWLARTKKRGEQSDRRASIPMTPLMTDIQRLATLYCRAGSNWLFPSERTSYRGKLRDVPTAESALNNVISRLCADAKEAKEFSYKKGTGRYKLKARQPGPLRNLQGFHVHDFRRTATTLCRDEGIARSDMSALLDHDDDDGSAATVTGRVYDQHEPVPARRRALDKWHDILERLDIRDCMAALETSWKKDKT